MKTSLFITIGACLVLIELKEIICCAPGLGDLGDDMRRRIIVNANPHQVVILRKDQSLRKISDVQICSGSLIAPEWILTAAQCVSTNEVRVILGVTNLQDRSQGMEFVVTSRDIISHPYYREENLSNDIALIKLPRKLQVSRFIQPTEIASKNNETYIHTMALLPGWGRTTLFADRLKQSMLEVITNEKCQEEHREPFFYIQCTHLCTASALSDVCAIDTGAPLFHINSRNERTQIGIVSKAPPTCRSVYPTVYTRVSLYRNWIDRIMGGEYSDVERTPKTVKKAATAKKTRNDSPDEESSTKEQGFVMPELEEDEDED